MDRTTLRLGWCAGLTLVALRLTIGFHFLHEGLEKVIHPKPFTAAFLENAVGPLAFLYHQMVWDIDGLQRLGCAAGQGLYPTLSAEPTRQAWMRYRDRLVAHYGLNEEQRQRAEQIVDRYVQLLEEFHRRREAEIREYYLGIQRRDAYRKDPNRTDVASLRGQLAQVVSQLREKRRELLAEVDALWSGLERDLNQLASPNGERGWLPIDKLGRRWCDSVTLDQVIPWFDVAVGICLITGMLVRLAGTFAAVFLASVIASQWPLDPQAASTWAQGVELAAMVHLVAVGAGRWAGLDSLLARCCSRCCRRQNVPNM